VLELFLTSTILGPSSTRSEPGLSLLSQPTRIAALNLQQVLRSAAAAAWRTPATALPSSQSPAMSSTSTGPLAPELLQERGPVECAALRQLDKAAEVSAVACGQCDAALLWLELEAAGGSTQASTAPPIAGRHAPADGDAHKGAEPVEGHGAEHAEVFVRVGSVKQGLSYLDAPVQLRPGQKAQLCLRPAQEGRSLYVTVAAAAARGDALMALTMGAAGWPRHALLAHWHWPMLADEARNGTFDAAIRRAAWVLSRGKGRLYRPPCLLWLLGGGLMCGL
jgi:hypothetical protein